MSPVWMELSSWLSSSSTTGDPASGVPKVPSESELHGRRTQSYSNSPLMEHRESEEVMITEKLLLKDMELRFLVHHLGHQT